MNLQGLFNDKSKKPKEKIEFLSSLILDASLPLDELLVFARTQKDPIKANIIEAFELATNEKPSCADEAVFEFVSAELAAPAPRIKWESARVIANIAYLFPQRLNEVTRHLLANASHDGTVVRWSSARALEQISKIRGVGGPHLFEKIKVLCQKEEKNSIRKIYLKILPAD